MAPAGALNKRKILRIMAKRPEVLCFALAVIITYLAKYTKSSKERTVYQSQPSPKHFFSSTSAVLDFPYGNLEDVGSLLEDEEVLFVMFYAPWCGNSMKTRPEFEKAATYLRHEVQFVAINCWYVKGECREKNMFMSFPVLYYYQIGLNGFKYSGLLTAEYISVFVQKLLHPVSYLTTDQQLVVFLSQSDNNMIGFFDFNASPQPPGYKQFYFAAMRAYERDHKNPIQFGVISDASLAEAFGMKSAPLMYYLRTLNDTLKYASSNNMTATAITNWVFSHRQKPWVQWILPSGLKSLTLSTEIQRGAALISFIPDTPLANKNQYFHMMREVAISYHNCKEEKKWDEMIQTSQFSRWESLTDYLDTLEKCNSLKPKLVPEVIKDTSLRHTTLPLKKCCLSVSVGNLNETQQPCVACINYEPDSASASQGCNVLSFHHILPLWGSSSSLFSEVPFLFRKYFQMDFCTEWKPTYNPVEHMTFCCHNNTRDHVTYHYEPISPKYTPDELHHFKNTDPYINDILKYREYEVCEKIDLLKNHKWLPYLEVASLGFDTLDIYANISGTGCQNKSLNFYAMSIKHGLPLASSLGLDIAKNKTDHGTVTLIVDLQNEVHHKMQENFTKQNLGYFIKNHTRNLLPRYLRSHNKLDPLMPIKRCDSMGTGACIITVTTNTFQDVVMDPEKDVVLLYYTPWCGFCASFSHTYISLSRYFRSSNKLVFARINADDNDLPWQYTVEAYPTILLYPAHKKEASIVFPDNLQKTLPNLVVFLLRYTTHSLKLETSLNICSKSCVDNNIAASSKRVIELNNEIIALQQRISRMEIYIQDIIKKLHSEKASHSDINTSDKSTDNWWVALLRRYTRLLKWRRNRKFLQKKNLRLLYSILKNSEGLNVEKRKLLRILTQYESSQKQLAQMIQSKHLDLDKNFVTDLRKVNKALDAQFVQGDDKYEDL